jgi:hypothetical protein
MNKPQTTEQPSSFPENWVPKVGDVLIAIDPCVMEDTGEAALVVGKEYVIDGVLGNDFWVTSSTNHKNYLGVSESNWQKFFKLKPTEPAKRYFIVGFSAEEFNGGIVMDYIDFVSLFGSFPSKKKLEKAIKDTFPQYDILNVSLQILSISELSETDYKQFYGEE